MALVMKQVIAVVDDRTTVICLDAAGQIQLDSKPYDTINGQFDEPPFHVSCRSISAPAMRGFVNDARDEANAELLRRPEKHRDWRSFKGIPQAEGSSYRGPSLREVPLNRYASKAFSWTETATKTVVTPVSEVTSTETLASAAKTVRATPRQRNAWRAYESGNTPAGRVVRETFDALPALKEPVTVYKATKVSGATVAAIIAAALVGKKILDRQTVSASTSAEAARAAAGGDDDQVVIIEITIPKGYKAAHLSALTGRKNARGEVVLPPGTALLITSDEIVDGVRRLKAQVTDA